jgi:hypothetical protein
MLALSTHHASFLARWATSLSAIRHLYTVYYITETFNWPPMQTFTCGCCCCAVLLQAAREAAKRLAVEKGIADIDRARPIPDPQDTGLIKGIKAVREQQQRQQEAQQQQQQQQQQQPSKQKQQEQQ